MRVYDLGSSYNVAVSEDDVYRFTGSWPGSGLTELRGVTFQFSKKNGDLIDIWYKNGDSERWDGPALLALSQDAQSYGEKKLGLAKKNPRAPTVHDLEESIVISSARGNDWRLVADGKSLGTFGSVRKALTAAKNWSKQHQYYPDIFVINDHGNVDLIDDRGTILASWV